MCVQKVFLKKLNAMFSRENTKESDTRTKNRKTGDIGESVAAEWLERKGFRVLERNYLRPWGEIDLICQKGTRLHFVEVKTVTRENLENVPRENDVYRPEDNIHQAKLERLRRTIQSYLAEKHPSGIHWQFDAVTVYLDPVKKMAKVERIEDIVL
jgi:putative endonuclease